MVIRHLISLPLVLRQSIPHIFISLLKFLYSGLVLRIDPLQTVFQTLLVHLLQLLHRVLVLLLQLAEKFLLVEIAGVLAHLDLLLGFAVRTLNRTGLLLALLL